MKNDFSIALISKDAAGNLLRQHHYLSKIQKSFKSGTNYGLIFKNEVVGVCIFTALPVPEICVGCFGLKRNEQDGIFELSRLAIKPEIQKTEHNITSWFVSRCLKKMKAQKAKAILSYADCDFHHGTIYAACNFKYYGKTSPKKDFFVVEDTLFGQDLKKTSRGTTKDKDGEWLERSQKHRFLMVFDKKLKTLWKEQKWPNGQALGIHT